MHKAFFDKLCFYFIYIFIPSIIFSNVVANAILIILSFFSCYLLFKKKIQIPNWLVYFFIFILFFLLHPNNFNNGLDFINIKNLIKIFFFIRFPLFLVLIIYLANDENNKSYFLKLFKIIILLLILLSIDIIFQFLFKFDILGITPGNWDENIKDFKRYSGFFGTELIGGAYLYLNSILILYFLNNKKFEHKKIYNLIVVALIFTATALSGERVALFKLSLIYFVFFLFFSSTLKREKILILCVFLLISILFFNNQTLKRRYIDNTLSEIGSISNIKENSYHFLHYQTAINIFRDNFIVGAGYKSFSVYCKKYEVEESERSNYKAIKSCSTHPHNMLFQILSSGGLIGSLIFIIFLYNLIIILIKEKNFILINYILIFYLPIIPSGSIFTSWINFNFWLILSLSLVFNKLYNK